MKKLLLFSIMLINLNSFSQITTVISGLDTPRELIVSGNDIYFVDSGSGKIYKFDFTSSNPSKTEILTGLINPESLLIKDNILYYGEDISGSNNDRLSKYDLSSTNSPTVIFSSILSPRNLLLHNNDIYFAEQVADRVSKFDITDSSPQAIIIIDNISFPTGLALVSNELYIKNQTPSPSSHIVSTLDISQTNGTLTEIFSTIDFFYEDIAIKDNYLYCLDFSGGIVYRFNLNNSNPIAEEIANGLNNPRNLLFIEDILYISELNQISKLDISTLSVLDIEKNEFSLYPNPSSLYIQFSGLLKEEEYHIYNVFGSEVSKGFISNLKKVNIQKLNVGIYFIKLENGFIQKFIKK